MATLQPLWLLTASRMDCAPESHRRRATCSPRAAAWSGVALADVLRAVDGADAGFEDEFAAFGACPRAEGHLTAALQGGEQSALGDYGGARFGVVERGENFGGLCVGEAAFRGNRPLPYRGKKNIGGKCFGNAVAPAEAVETGFG